MKSFFSFLFKVSTKNRRFGSLSKTESALASRLSPFDWFVYGVFGALMTLGAALLFINASNSLSVEIPTRGGTHIEGVVGNPRFINPLLAISETDNDLTQLVFAGLMKGEPDGSLSPNVAEKYTVSDDQLSYTFTLRSDVTFHDGTPVKAEDVVFTVQAAKNPEIKSPKRANWDGVDVVALDEHTVTFTLKSPYALFLNNTTMGILPKHLWSGVQPEEFPFSELNTKPVGAGPFRIGSIKKNSSGVPSEYRLEAYERAAHAPFIQNFVFRFYTNQEAVGAALATGDINAAHSILPETIKNAATHEAVFGRVFSVFFNQNQQRIFTEQAVREALDASIDKKQLVDTMLAGYGVPLSGPLPPSQVQNSSAPDTRSEDERLENARRILEENGWEKGEDGVFVKETKSDGTLRLSFSLATGNASELRQTAEFVAHAWRALGAEVNLQFFDQNDLNLEVIRPRKYDALLFGLVVGRELDLFAFWHSSQRNDPGLNVALYANIVTDSLLEEARFEEDAIKRREKAEAASAEITRDVAAVFLYAPYFVYLTEETLSGVQLGTISTPSDRFFSVEDWYLKTERVWPVFQ